MRFKRLSIILVILVSVLAIGCSKNKQPEVRSNLKEFVTNIETDMDEKELKVEVAKMLKDKEGQLVDLKVEDDEATVKYVAEEEIITSGTSFLKEVDKKDEVKEFNVNIISNVGDLKVLEKDIKRFLDINNGEFLSLKANSTKFSYNLSYKADRELIKNGDEWTYEDEYRVSNYEVKLISSLNEEEVKVEIQKVLSYLKGKILSIELVEEQDGYYKYVYDLKYQATREAFIDEEIVGPVEEGTVINKEEDEKKEDEEDPSSNNISLEEYNRFIKESYAGVFNDFLNNQKEKSLVYSPFSYKKALEGLGNLTNEFNEDSYIGNAVSKQMGEVSNVNTKTITILNKELFESDDETLKLLSFNKDEGASEAEKASKELQEEILDEVLLPPDYDDSLASAILNATRFYGKWEKPFNKENTVKDEFTTIDNKKVEKDIMFDSKLGKIGIDNELVKVGSKRLEEEDSYVYFIEAKKWDKDSLKEIANNITNYIEAINSFEEADNSIAKYYDIVNVSVPRLDIKSNIDLSKVEKENGHESIFKSFKEKETIKRIGDDNSPLVVSKIAQVASMRMDEEEIEAKAVTEMQVEMTALLPEEETVLEIDCTHPHFVVTVSGGVISFIGFVGD